MGILMQDGCDMYGTDEVKAEVYGWTRVHGTQEFVQATGGRDNLGCCGMQYSTNGWRWTLPKVDVTTLFAFTALKYANDTHVSTYGFMELRNNTSILLGRVRINAAHQVEIYDADNTLQDTSTLTLSIDAWHTVQAKFVCHATTGSIEVWVNGVQYAIATTIDTMPASGNQYVEVFTFGKITNDTIEYRDDLVLWDDSGSNFNTWTTGKDIEIETRRCNAVGNLSQWTKSAGANNYENVDETPDHDVDATYNYDSTPGNADRIGIEALSITPDAIYNVRTRAVMRKTDAGPALAKVGVYSSTTEDVSAPQGLSTDYTFLHHDNELNPADSLAWEKADIDALQVQYEVA